MGLTGYLRSRRGLRGLSAPGSRTASVTTISYISLTHSHVNGDTREIGEINDTAMCDFAARTAIAVTWPRHLDPVVKLGLRSYQ